MPFFARTPRRKILTLQQKLDVRRRPKTEVGQKREPYGLAAEG